ncbi:MAG: arylsulfatase [Saprospiraceae bacterium]|nr:arylsulfatase [Saprospiraceae bacterium]
MQFFDSTFWLFMVLIAGCSTGIADDPDRDTRPNVIILYADDMGYGDLACQNLDSKIPTPHLDRLASEGLRFTDGHSSSGICTPSRYALLTGRYHWRDFNNIVGPMGESVFDDGQFTLARMFKQVGYRTGCVGKWHLGWGWESVRKKEWTQKDSLVRENRRNYYFYPSEAYDWSLPIPDGPLDQGFDYYFGDGTINFPPYAWVENDRLLESPTWTMRHPQGMALEGNWEARPGPAVEGWDFFEVLPRITKKAKEYIVGQQDQKEPFFLYVPFSAPHAPIIPNEEFRGLSQAGPYGDFVHQTDWCVGEILKALEQIGESDNTIVIFTADNGPERYAYERIRKYDHHSAHPFRGLKRDVYEGGHHVPFLVKWPGKIKPNALSNQLIHQVDLLKTLAAIVDVTLPAGLAHDSHDFSEVWLGETSNLPIRPLAVHNTFQDKYGLRQGDWIYINSRDGYHSKPPDWVEDHFSYEPSDAEVLLFNLKDDIGQGKNLALEMPEKVQEMQALLTNIRSGETFIEQ